MPNNNFVERTHTTTKIEFSFGLGDKYGGSLSLNRDNQTGERSITGCLSRGVLSGGEIKGRVNYGENEPGGIADSAELSASVTGNAFVGLGPAYEGSYNPFNTKLEFTQSTPNESANTGFGLGVDLTAEGCFEGNLDRGLQKLGEFKDWVLDKLFDNEKDSIFDKESSPTEKLNFKDSNNSQRDSRDSFHDGKESGLGGLGDGRSLGERPERPQREHFKS